MNDQKNFFTWSELTTTNTGLPNNPSSPFHLDNLSRLWKYLNFLRQRLGAPISINSAFRTPEVNQKVGGSKGSFHMQGLAADICTRSSCMPVLRDILETHYEFGGDILCELIDHQTYFHISISTANPKNNLFL